MLQARRSQVRVLMRSLDLFNLHNPSNPSMALESTQPLTEMSTRNLVRGKRQLVHMPDNLTVISELIV
jgi:hypothetical protein